MNDLRIQRTMAYIGGTPCNYWLQEYSSEWVKVRKSDYCPICNCKLEVNDSFYLTMNNFKLFPNCLVHYDCISKQDAHRLSWMDFVGASELIHQNFNKYNELIKTFNGNKRKYKTFNAIKR